MTQSVALESNLPSQIFFQSYPKGNLREWSGQAWQDGLKLLTEGQHAHDRSSKSDTSRNAAVVVVGKLISPVDAAQHYQIIRRRQPSMKSWEFGLTCIHWRKVNEKQQSLDMERTTSNHTIGVS